MGEFSEVEAIKLGRETQMDVQRKNESNSRVSGMLLTYSVVEMKFNQWQRNKAD